MKNLTVVTNTVNIPFIIGGQPGITLLLTSGEFKAPTLSLTGEKAAAFFDNLHADKLFLATAGISLKSGLTYPSISDLVVKKAMIEAANCVYLLADSTKIGKSALASLGALSLVDYLITDKEIKSISLLEKYLSIISQDSTQVTDILRHINRLRQGYPIHGDFVNNLFESYKFLDIQYPIQNYKHAWKIILFKYKQSLEILFNIFKQNL